MNEITKECPICKRRGKVGIIIKDPLERNLARCNNCQTGMPWSSGAESKTGEKTMKDWESLDREIIKEEEEEKLILDSEPEEPWDIEVIKHPMENLFYIGSINGSKIEEVGIGSDPCEIFTLINSTMNKIVMQNPQIEGKIRVRFDKKIVSHFRLNIMASEIEALAGTDTTIKFPEGPEGFMMVEYDPSYLGKDL